MIPREIVHRRTFSSVLRRMIVKPQIDKKLFAHELKTTTIVSSPVKQIKRADYSIEEDKLIETLDHIRIVRSILPIIKMIQSESSITASSNTVIMKPFDNRRRKAVAIQKAIVCPLSSNGIRPSPKSVSSY